MAVCLNKISPTLGNAERSFFLESFRGAMLIVKNLTNRHLLKAYE